MIQKYKILGLSIFLNLWTSTLQAQEPKTTWVLNKGESTTKNYVARESIKLQNDGTTSGFSFKADPNDPSKTFSAKIDAGLLFPPKDGTYMLDGTITGDPSKDAFIE